MLLLLICDYDDDIPDDGGGAVEHLVREIQYSRLLLLLQNDGRNG